MIIHPYKLGSRGAKRLKDAINTASDRKVCWVLQRPPKGQKTLIINWGASEFSYPEGNNWIVNDPVDVSTMSDKCSFFEKVGHNDDYLPWTTRLQDALEWGEAGAKVFARLLTRGSGGRGIHVWTKDSGEPLPVASLYTKHQPKTHEYRLHMARSLNGACFEPILIQRKVWKSPEPGKQPKSWDVRSHDNGFIFQAYPSDAEGLAKIPASVLAVSRKAMARDFGAMHFVALDVLYHKPTDKAVICEGNTAPGLENNTVDVYAAYFRGLNEEFRKERMVSI